MPPAGANPHPRLASAVRACIPALHGDWLAKVRQAVPALRDMSDEEVLDNLPPLLEAIAAALEEPARGHAALSRVGGVHGLTRFHQKLTGSDLGIEYPLLRHAIVAAVRRELGRAPPTEEESDALHGLIDRVIHLSNAAYASLQEKEMRLESEATGRHLAMLSHDLRNTLNAAMLSMHLVGERLRGMDAPEVEELVEEINESRRMAFGAVEAMNRLLEAERLRGHSVPISTQPVDVCGLLNSVRAAAGRAHTMQSGAGSASGEDALARIDISCPAGTVIRTDPDLLSTILQNLVGNALRHGGGTPVTLRAGWRKAPVNPGDKPQNGERLVIEVIDRGPGIAPEQLSTIFAPFQRGAQPAPSDAGASGGVGLGLFIARRAADLIGARLQVSSEPGKGATFAVCLPQH